MSGPSCKTVRAIGKDGRGPRHRQEKSTKDREGVQGIYQRTDARGQKEKK